MPTSPTLEARIERALDRVPRQRSLWIALSGGLDSCVLLALAARACGQRSRRLRAIHVHHGLQAAADDFERHCRRLCAQQGVTLEVVRARVDRTSGKGLEAAARQARYDAFVECLDAGDVLWLAQHSDDQAETLLLAALRRAGVAGLAAMPARREERGLSIERPLLEVRRSELEAEARRRGLDWVEDPSNASREFDRNYLRHEVVPALEQRWPDAADALAVSARHAGEAAALLDEYALEDLARLGGDPARLELEGLLSLSRRRQRWLIGLCMRRLGLAPAPGPRLDDLLEQCHARRDAEVKVSWPGAEARLWRGALWLMGEGAGDPLEVAEGPWSPGSALVVAGVSMKLPTTEEETPLPLWLRQRQGGERLRLAGRGSRDLKRLLQEAGVPPWRRAQVLVVWQGEVCVAALDAGRGCWIALAEGWTASPLRATPGAG
ncbi:tRNA lysidine(34) synthetase TilS [Halomonas sp. OfavH-34-E]|uniref:tRNA lysidine(34) synthetase TilS n=1 Tax=Halomonas sp. OfavH-34-E TaxID=2954491 RepID=UPI00209798FD|nr:tRNA lysidine(34) synthetase TilS [Halomonas sp. OfavH-34-E]MCO7214591.1 tRNA lysidine(34) synthetase TilS [Halomonas sp. OfavH-34-E]